MKTSPRRVMICLAGAGFVLAAGPADALFATCTTSASGVAFGSYDPTSTSADTTTGTVTVSCTALISLLVSYTISLNSGGSGSFATRKMHLVSNLNYNLYTSASLSQVWGDGTAGTGTVSDSYLLGIGTTNRSYNVYGNLPGSQNVPPGAYGDTIMVTVTY